MSMHAVAIRVLIGVATMYAHDAHAGNPLRCDGVYDTTHEWVAADVDNGPFSCFDWLTICPEGGVCKTLQVLDSGPLSLFCVMGEDGICRDILIDVPEHVAIGWFPGLSTPVRVIDASAVRQRWELER